MEHCGENMKFQFSDARNSVASVTRITEHGNTVQFGPEEEDNYIYHPRTEEKTVVWWEGRKFVMDVGFVRNGSAFRGQAGQSKYHQRALSRASVKTVRTKL